MPRKGIFKRDTLLRNLKRAIERTSQLDLPVNIVAVYTFGGILREKDRLHDFDLVFLYSMTTEQQIRWNRFRRNFSTYDMDSKRQPLSELMGIFEPFMISKTPLREVVKDERVSEVLSKKSIPPHWCGCFSWTDIFHSPSGFFSPDIRTVLHRMIIGRRFRGLQVHFMEHRNFIEGRSSLVPKNYLLAWSPEKPNIYENIENRPLKSKIDFIIKELDYFTKEKIPLLKKGSELVKGYLDVKDSVIKNSLNANVKIDVDLLDRQHTEIRRTGNESYSELLEKCELAREEMRKYRRETIVLEAIADSLLRWIEVRDNQEFDKHPGEDFISLWVIQGVNKRAVNEREIRKTLQILKLPEDHIITIEGYGYKYYSLIEDEEDKKRLLKEAELEKLRKKYLKGIMKVIRPLDREARAYLGLNEQGKPKGLGITIWRSIRPEDENRKKATIKNLTKKGFKVEDWAYQIKGTKQVNLKGEEDLKQLQEIAKQMILTS